MGTAKSPAEGTQQSLIERRLGSWSTGRGKRRTERLQTAELGVCPIAMALARTTTPIPATMRIALPQPCSRQGYPALDSGDFRTGGGWIGADFPTSSSRSSRVTSFLPIPEFHVETRRLLHPESSSVHSFYNIQCGPELQDPNMTSSLASQELTM